MVPVSSLSKMFKAINNEDKMANFEQYSTEDLKEFLQYIKTHEAREILSQLKSNELFHRIILPMPSAEEMENLIKLEQLLEYEINRREKTIANS